MVESDPMPALHLLPCSIQYEGEAKVSGYFQPVSTGRSVDGLAILNARFRGRILQGAAISLPENFVGYITKPSSISEPISHQQEVEETFRDFAYWNHERPPAKGDPLRKCFEWLELATEVHSAVTPEEVAATMKSGLNN
eukprot:jgi/Botrbrau1/18507/Bobra.0072s0085.1